MCTRLSIKSEVKQPCHNCGTPTRNQVRDNIAYSESFESTSYDLVNLCNRCTRIALESMQATTLAETCLLDLDWIPEESDVTEEERQELFERLCVQNSGLMYNVPTR
jgi:hypothetical protein